MGSDWYKARNVDDYGNINAVYTFVGSNWYKARSVDNYRSINAVYNILHILGFRTYYDA